MTQDISKGDIIEICETMIFDPKEADVLLQQTRLINYLFAHEDGKRVILALGNGSLYNHKSPSNAVYEFWPRTKQMVMVAAENIPAGAEVFINYGGTQQAKYEWEFKGSNIA